MRGRRQSSASLGRQLRTLPGAWAIQAVRNLLWDLDEHADREPTPASPEQIRRIQRVDIPGGVVHEYRHAA